MIQVIQKVFKTLELLDAAEGTGLSKLAADTKINKGTLCNILKTLVELGYVSKNGNGNYLISRKFFQLAYPFSMTEKITGMAEKFSRALAERTMESGVVTTLRGAEVRIVAQAQHNRSLMLNPEVYKDLSLFHSVSGRILIAFLDDKALRAMTDKIGLPGADWDGMDDFESLSAAAADIRKSGISVMKNKSTEIKAFAVPALDHEGKICASLGLTVPLFRLAGGKEKKIVAELKENAGLLEKEMASESLRQKDWFGMEEPK